MAAAVQRITVSEPEQMQFQVTSLVAQGFVVANQSNRSVTLIKRKQFSVPMLIIGFLLCVVPLLIYLIVYALQSDQVIEVTLVNGPAAAVPYRASEHLPGGGPDAPPVGPAPVIQLSPDGNSWWNGQSWVDLADQVPPNAARKPDGTAWWDGKSWRPTSGS